MKKMRYLLCRASVLAAIATALIASDSAAHAVSKPAQLPTGATITPDAAPGSVFQPLTVALPDYPNFQPDSAQTTAVSPDGKTLLVLTSGFNLNLDSNGNFQPADSTEFVFVYDISKPIKPVRKQVVLVPNAFSGIVWSPDGTRFYVAGGQDDNIHTYAVSGGTWSEAGSPINLGHSGDLMNQETFVGPTAAGVSITADGKKLVVANYETDSVTLVDLVAGTVTQEYDLRPGRINPADSGVPGGEFPFGVAIKGNNTVYVSSSRDREIVVLRLHNDALSVVSRIPVPGNPNKMLLNSSQSRLFVTSNNADALLVIDTTENELVALVNTSAPLGQIGKGNTIPKGSNPNSIAFSPDEQTAYVTNGGTNDVAVISLGHSPRVVGLIPTGWQPNSSSVSSDGRVLYIVNGKSDPGPNPLNCRFINAGGNYGSACQSVSAQNGSGNQYAFQNTKAGFLVLPVPGEESLEKLTDLVAANNGFKLELSGQDKATMQFLRQHIQHVIYIVKENRTFDQILGDLQNGANADPSLTQFPSFVTPNFHNFANRFVTFDNFYDSGIVSMDGWQWSTAARALDLNEKNVVVNYGKGGANYDSEGTDRNVNVAVTGVANRKAWQSLYPNDPDLLPGNRNEVEADGPGDELGAGYIWDAALRAKLSVRNYGFFLDLGAVQGLDPNLTNPAATKTRVAYPATVSLLSLTDPYFRGFDQAFPDYFRFQEWAREFDQQAASNSFPNFEMVRFNHDHFGSFGQASFGVNTPETQIADDDYAVGLLLDKIAHSKYANSTLVFVIEDDPQDGADHVSGQRSVAFILGPYVKQGAVVSTQYATVNMLRTIEEVLGLQTLSVHDSGVPPMTDAFDTNQNCHQQEEGEDGGTRCWTYKATPAKILFSTTLPIPKDTLAKNATIPQPTHTAAWWADHTKRFDFSSEDKVDSDAFNRIIWQGLMGDRPYPTERSGLDLSKRATAAGTPN